MLRFMQFNDLHVCDGDGWESLDVFRHLVEQVNIGCADRLHFAVIPGDHDVESGSLQDFFQILAPGALPHVENVADVRIILLDIVSAGSGGPDFRLARKQTDWLRATLQGDPDTQTVVLERRRGPAQCSFQTLQ